MNAEPAPAPPSTPERKVSVGCLVAVLAVAALIIVGGLSSPFVPHRHGPDLQAKVTMKGLEIGIKGYNTEYLHLPYSGPSQPANDITYDTTSPEGKALIDVLLGTDQVSNPRQVRFWETPPLKSNGAGYSAEAGLRDRWGKAGYKVALDYNSDGKIANPAAGRKDEPDELTSDVIMYSAGPDGDFSTWNDNVRSWQR